MLAVFSRVAGATRTPWFRGDEGVEWEFVKRSQPASPAGRWRKAGLSWRGERFPSSYCTILNLAGMLAFGGGDRPATAHVDALDQARSFPPHPLDGPFAHPLAHRHAHYRDNRRNRRHSETYSSCAEVVWGHRPPTCAGGVREQVGSNLTLNFVPLQKCTTEEPTVIS